MTYSEALRQRQIVIEHLRNLTMNQWSSVDDVEYFDSELLRLDELVNAKWLELVCS